jgi:hypothetical protein
MNILITDYIDNIHISDNFIVFNNYYGEKLQSLIELCHKNNKVIILNFNIGSEDL